MTQIKPPTKERMKSAEGLARSLAYPKMQFDLQEEIQKLRKEETWLKMGRNAKTLVKYSDFRIVLTLLKAEKRMKEHKAEGRISIHVLTGKVRLHMLEEKIDLSAGQILALERGLPHDVEALKDTAFLISISWQQRKP